MVPEVELISIEERNITNQNTLCNSKALHFIMMDSSKSTFEGEAPCPTLSDSVLKMFDMTGKVVIVTGGSGGIGYEAARGLAEAGANVSLHRALDVTIRFFCI